jgi:CSLREA domain-containing protein
MQSVASKADATVDVPALAPGIWLHRVSVAATGQQQFRQSLVVDDPNRSSALDWTLFATVLTVNQAADDGDGRCDTTCTLRDAVMKANKAKRPVLIVFDHTVLGTPAEVNRRTSASSSTRPG